MNKSIVFAHDHKFIEGPDGLVYSHGAYPSAFWERYLRYVTTVTVLGRVAEEKGELHSRYVVSSRPNVDFRLSPILKKSWRLGVYRDGYAEFVKNQVQKADFIVARLPSEIGLMACFFARKYGKPLAVELVGSPKDAYRNHGSVLGIVYSLLSDFRNKVAVRNANAALYVARYLRDAYSVQSGINTAVCSNVVISEIEKDENVRLRHGRMIEKRKSGSTYIIGVIGSFTTRYKGIDVAVKALSELRRRGLQVVLRVLGDGDKEPYLFLAKSLGVEESIFFDGIVPAGDPVVKWLNQLDIYIQPSYTEGMPRGLLEAMARGLPAAASRVGGIPDVLGSEVLHSPGDYHQLADCLQLIIADDGLPFSSNNILTASSFLDSTIEKRRSDYYEGFFR